MSSCYGECMHCLNGMWSHWDIYCILPAIYIYAKLYHRRREEKKNWVSWDTIKTSFSIIQKFFFHIFFFSFSLTLPWLSCNTISYTCIYFFMLAISSVTDSYKRASQLERRQSNKLASLSLTYLLFFHAFLFFLLLHFIQFDEIAKGLRNKSPVVWLFLFFFSWIWNFCFHC